MSDNKLAQFTTLSKQLVEWESAYHDGDSEKVPDHVYNETRQQVEALAKELGINYTRTVGGRAGKVLHKYPMLSLKDVFNKDELHKWLQGVYKTLGERFTYIVEYKNDGLAISLRYQNGELVQALTRGDGVSGDDVTERFLQLCPSWARTDVLINGEIRGEGIVTTLSFNRHNATREESELEPYSTQRHLAAAMLRGSGEYLTGFHFIPYEVIEDDATIRQIDDYSTTHTLLKLEGSNSHTYASKLLLSRLQYNSEMINTIIDDVQSQRAQIPHLIDGLVLKVNLDKHKQKLGYSSTHPKWAVAFKFPPEGAWSVLRDVYFQVGKRGRITPVGDIDPVTVGGVEITNPTLHNWGEILRLGLNIGSKVYLERRGDVIPKVTYVENPETLAVVEGVTNIPYPERCPCCDIPTIVEGAYIVCNNPFCQEKITAKVVDGVGKFGFDIIGLGDTTIRNLVDEGLVSSVADVFKLTEEQLSEEGGLGDVRAKKVREVIRHASTNTPLHRFLYAVGFSGVGVMGAKKLAMEVEGEWKSYIIERQEGDEQGLLSFINLLSEVQVQLPVFTKVPLIPVCVTGSFDVSRDVIAEVLETKGYQVTSNVTKGTRYLFVGKKPTQKKIDVAKAKGVVIAGNTITTLDAIKTFLHFEETKVDNFKASSRLEGINL